LERILSRLFFALLPFYRISLFLSGFLDKRDNGYVEFLSNTLSNRDFYGKAPNEFFVSKVLTVLDKNLFIAGFNSCTVTSEPEKLRNIGLVGYRQMQLCNEALSKVGKKIHRKIALVHHHPSYIPLLSDDNNEYDALSQSG
jgi:hypothetical protein